MTTLTWLCHYLRNAIHYSVIIEKLDRIMVYFLLLP